MMTTQEAPYGLVNRTSWRPPSSTSSERIAGTARHARPRYILGVVLRAREHGSRAELHRGVDAVD